MKPDISESICQSWGTMSEKDQKLTHLIDSLSNIVERMEVISKDQQWGLLDEGYKQATSDWAFELKQLLEEKGG